MKGREAIGLVALACAACCAAPLLALIGAAGAGAAIGFAVFGAVGLLGAAIAVPVWVRRRRQRCAVPEGPVLVQLGDLNSES